MQSRMGTTQTGAKSKKVSSLEEKAKKLQKEQAALAKRAAAREEQVAELVSTLTNKFEHLFRGRLITRVLHNGTKFPLQKSN
ncbi:hypothetical protein FRC20_006962 [Serendipita sp. 405]|nr:hypothetical protein FRC20_006962 [Serendipita sp. 405]